MRHKSRVALCTTYFDYIKSNRVFPKAWKCDSYKIPRKRENVDWHFHTREKFYAHTSSRCTNLLTSTRNEITGEIESEVTREYCATCARFARAAEKYPGFQGFLWRRDAQLRRTGAEARTKIASILFSRFAGHDLLCRVIPTADISIRSLRFNGWAYAPFRMQRDLHKLVGVTKERPFRLRRMGRIESIPA